MEILREVPRIVILVAVLVVLITVALFLDIPIVKTVQISQTIFNITQDVTNTVYTGWYSIVFAAVLAVLAMIIIVLVLAIRGKD